MSASTSDVLRFTRGRACPTCQGCDADHRGQGRRCVGYLSGDGKTVFCSREGYAGAARVRLRDAK
jgi:hypothetical protein